MDHEMKKARIAVSFGMMGPQVVEAVAFHDQNLGRAARVVNGTVQREAGVDAELESLVDQAARELLGGDGTVNYEAFDRWYAYDPADMEEFLKLAQAKEVVVIDSLTAVSDYRRSRDTTAADGNNTYSGDWLGNRKQRRADAAMRRKKWKAY